MAGKRGEKMMTSDKASLARSYQLSAADLDIAAMHVAALNEDLQLRVATLDQDELLILRSIKDKLNEGLSDRLKEVADTVGGFVW
jgi:hypothetical protein